MAFTSRFLPAALSLALTRQHPGYIKGGVALSLSLLSCRSAGLSSTAAARGDEKTPSDGVILHRGVTLLGQEAAAALDVDLMQEPDGFKLEQLMELAPGVRPAANLRYIRRGVGNSVGRNSSSPKPLI